MARSVELVVVGPCRHAESEFAELLDGDDLHVGRWQWCRRCCLLDGLRYDIKRFLELAFLVLLMRCTDADNIMRQLQHLVKGGHGRSPFYGFPRVAPFRDDG